jgi:hypothetical protein
MSDPGMFKLDGTGSQAQSLTARYEIIGLD